MKGISSGNLGVVPGLIAATALLIDYVLTVAVSVSAGISAIVSAAPSLDPYRVALALACIGLIAWGNLRGIRQSRRIFAAPTYAFIASVTLLLSVGLWRTLTGQLPPDQVPLGHDSTATVGIFLLLHAFANGCTAMTGVEAISNGIPAFKKPESLWRRTNDFSPRLGFAWDIGGKGKWVVRGGTSIIYVVEGFNLFVSQQGVPAIGVNSIPTGALLGGVPGPVPSMTMSAP